MGSLAGYTSGLVRHYVLFFFYLLTPQIYFILQINLSNLLIIVERISCEHPQNIDTPAALIPINEESASVRTKERRQSTTEKKTRLRRLKDLRGSTIAYVHVER